MSTSAALLHPGGLWRSLTAQLYAARALRALGDGFISILLPVYLTRLGLGPVEVGAVATATLLGSGIATLVVGHLGTRRDQRGLLLLSSFLMMGTGLAYAVAGDLALLLIVGFVGTLNPSSGDVSIFVPLEHAMLARSAPDEVRTRVFARYSLIGALAAAVGSLLAPAPLLLTKLGVSELAALRGMFVAYAALGLASALIYRQLPASKAVSPAPGSSALGPSRHTVYKLAALFSLDAFAGGFIVQSLLALWLFERFGLSLTTAGVFFFWSGVLSAFSFPVAAWIGSRIGLINTMVFTHIPSSICLILAAFAPNVGVALTLLLLRAALSQMDVPTRTSYVMAVVTPAERPAAASITAVPRSLAASIGPAFAGALLTTSFLGWPLVICGALKITYDLLLLRTFWHIKPPEEGPAAGSLKPQPRV